MNSKGISPMVATVLLIAFTVAVGGIVSVWMTGFTTSTTGSVESASTNQTKCAGVYIDIISVNDASFMIRNPSAQPINGITCYSGNGTLITSDPINLATGGSINSTIWDRDGYTSIICGGTCLNIGVSGECKSGQTCWN